MHALFLVIASYLLAIQRFKMGFLQLLHAPLADYFHFERGPMRLPHPQCDGFSCVKSCEVRGILSQDVT